MLRRPAIYLAAIVVGAVAFAVGLPWWAAVGVAVLALVLGAALATWLFVVGARLAGAPASPSDSAASVFRREGEYWTITYQGSTFRLADSKGLHHIHRLLETPGAELHVLDLAAAAQPAGKTAARDEGLHVASSAPPVVDQEALRSYRLRIEDLRDQIEEAEANADPERGARAREELDQLLEEIGRVTGRGGRPRAHADETERARLNVTRAIRKAIEKIGEQDRSLGHHLDHEIRTGIYCTYDPDPATAPVWVR